MKPISLPKKIVYALTLIFLNVWFYTQNVPFHTAAAWISYLFAHIAFLAMVFAPLLTTPGIRAEDSKFDLQMIAVIYFLAEVLAVWVFSAVLPFGWRLALVLQLAALIVFVVLVFGSAAADRDTEQAARRKKAEVGYLRECCAVLEDVMPQMNDPAQRRQVKLLYDQLHAKQDKYDQNYCFKFGLYGNLLVDGEGKRFINEGLLCDYPMSYGSEQILLNAPWYGIVDQAYVDAMTTQGLYEYTTAKGATSENWFIGNYFKGRILDNLPSDIEEGLKEGWLAKADTIEELGEKFGLTNLAETVEKYNEYCEKGVDEQFGANKWYLSPVKEGPFYAVQCEPSAWSTFGGVRTDDCCRALDIDNQPIDGLYVAGTDSGSLYYSPYYDIPGFCYGLCIDSGYICAEEAAKFVKA